MSYLEYGWKNVNILATVDNWKSQTVFLQSFKWCLAERGGSDSMISITMFLQLFRANSHTNEVNESV